MNARIGCALVLAGIIIVTVGIVNSVFDTNEQAQQMAKQARQRRVDQGNRERAARRRYGEAIKQSKTVLCFDNRTHMNAMLKVGLDDGSDDEAYTRVEVPSNDDGCIKAATGTHRFVVRFLKDERVIIGISEPFSVKKSNPPVTVLLEGLGRGVPVVQEIGASPD